MQVVILSCSSPMTRSWLAGSGCMARPVLLGYAESGVSSLLCSGSMFHLPMPLRKWLFYSFLASGVPSVCPLLGMGFASQQPTPSQEVVFTFLFWRWRSLAMRASPVGCSPDDLTKTKTKTRRISSTASGRCCQIRRLPQCIFRTITFFGGLVFFWFC